MTSKCHSRNSLLDVFVSTLPLSLFLSLPFHPPTQLHYLRKCHSAIDSFDCALLILFALFCRRRSINLPLSPSGNNRKRDERQTKTPHLARVKVARYYFHDLSVFICIYTRLNLIYENLKLPNVSRMNYRAPPQRASNDSSWRVYSRDRFSLRSFDEDLNFAKADSDLHRWDRSNTSRSGQNGRARAHVRRERIRNVNVAWRKSRATDCILCRYLGRNYCLISYGQDWHVVYYSVRGLFDGKWWLCELLPLCAPERVARCNSPRALHRRCDIRYARSGKIVISWILRRQIQISEMRSLLFE